MKITKWDGCYDGGWGKEITKDSYSHPAKMARGLLERIVRYGLEQGWWKKGDIIGDPFGGIGSTGIVCSYYGLRSVLNELEPKFVTCAELNFVFHRSKWDRLGSPHPIIHRGDSRRFDQIVDAILSSPPYANSVHDGNGVDTSKEKGHPSGPNSQMNAQGYGRTDGQIGRLSGDCVDSVIASPPFAGTSGQGGGGINVRGYVPAEGRKWTGDKPDPVGSRTYQGQGGDRTEGNIETLKEGTVAAVVSSPPFRDARSDTTKCTPTKQGGPCAERHHTVQAGAGYGESNGQIDNLKTGEVAAVISSPPYSDIAAGAGGLNTKPAKHPGQQSGRKSESASQDTDQRYGTSEGQISQLKGGTVDACISSPPYAGISPEKSGPGVNIEKQYETYRASGGGMSLEAFRAQKLRHAEGYGASEGQISQLKGGSVDGVVSSPPWENNCEGNTKASKFNGYLPDNGKGHYASPEAKKRAAEKADSMEYGSTEGQIGKEKAETYWQAVKLVYEACFRCIKPGGHICLVVKDYCKAGKRVRLCDDTMRLLEHIGFVPVERIHAMLVTETSEQGFFEVHKTKRERKSFFRRTYEKRIPEGDERRIDFEEVLVCRKPA